MNKPKSLYIHIPFCNTICGYCDFTKLQYFPFQADNYLKELEKELCSLNINNQLDTIYIGGGTPTSLSLDQLQILFEMIKPYCSNVKEFTIECNPESLDEQKIMLFKSYGVNRISMGVESTNDNILRLISRKHTFKDVIEKVELLRKHHINNIALDLIIGLPQVSKKMLEEDIYNILLLKPNHLSTYSLTVHPHTKFYLDGINEPNEDFVRESYDMIHQIMTENGYEHYEISSFCLPGYHSKHNMCYWKNDQYYAVGLGASGYIDNTRYTNTKNILSYLKSEYKNEEETNVLSLNDKKEYALMLLLRTNKGIDIKLFNFLYQTDFEKEYLPKIKEDINVGLLEYNKENQTIVPTYEGMMILDRIILKLLD